MSISSETISTPNNNDKGNDALRTQKYDETTEKEQEEKEEKSIQKYDYLETDSESGISTNNNSADVQQQGPPLKKRKLNNNNNDNNNTDNNNLTAIHARNDKRWQHIVDNNIKYSHLLEEFYYDYDAHEVICKLCHTSFWLCNSSNPRPYDLQRHLTKNRHIQS